MNQKGSVAIFLAIIILIILAAVVKFYFPDLPSYSSQQPQIASNTATPKSKNVGLKIYNASHFASSYGKAYNFSVRYPSDWTAEDQDNGTFPSIWFNPVDGSGEHKQIHIFVTQNTSLENWQTDNAGTRTSVKTSTMTAGNLGKIIVVEYTGPAGVGLVYGKAFAHINTVYNIFVTTDGLNPEKYQYLIDQILTTYEIF
ncbi:MAG: hypothetical protein Q7R49_03395 [Candidatus Daviesbacteria bacterium]|nr:hypothetical protein [Candidatus Daviesbacteria bacterium]